MSKIISLCYIIATRGKGEGNSENIQVEEGGGGGLEGFKCGHNQKGRRVLGTVTTRKWERKGGLNNNI